MLNLTWAYVGVVYAAGVALGRRAGAALPRRVALLFFALVLLFFRHALTSDAINVPVDYYESLPPWANVIHGAKSSNPFVNDVALQLVPWAHAVRQHWRALEAPLWEPSAGSGYPLLANGQSQALSLLRLLALPLSLGHAMAAEGAWKVLIALTFTFLFCRRRGYSPIASTAGAIAFGFSGFIVVWLHFAHATVACFLPAVLYAIDLLAERRSSGRFAFAALLWGVILTGGHPETAAHAGFLAVLFTGWIASVERPFATRSETWRFVRASGGSVATGALLAAPFLLPFAEAVRKSLRFAALSSAPHPIGVLADWASTVAMLQPRFFGSIPAEEPWGPAIPETITGFAGTLAVLGSVALLARVAATRNWRSRDAFIAVALVICIGVVYSWPGVIQLFNLVFRLAPPARVRCLIALLTAIGAAAAVDLLERRERWPVVAGAVASALLLAAMMTFRFPTPAHRHASLVAIVPAFVVLAMVAIVVVLPRRIVLLVLLVAAIGEQWAAFGGWNAVLPSTKLYAPTPLVRELMRLRDSAPPNAPFRICAYAADLFPNLSAIYGLEDIRVHDPMASWRYVAMLGVAGGYDSGGYFAMWTNTSTPLLDYLNVRYFVTSPGRVLDGPRFVKVYDGPDGMIFENRNVLPRFYAVRRVAVEWELKRFIARLAAANDWAHEALLENLVITDPAMRADLIESRGGADATVAIVRASSTEYALHVVAPRQTLVASSIPFWPGWHVRTGNRALTPMRINGAFVGFLLPAGTHDVRVWYAPWSFRIGLSIAAITLIALAVAVARRSQF